MKCREAFRSRRGRHRTCSELSSALPSKLCSRRRLRNRLCVSESDNRSALSWRMLSQTAVSSEPQDGASSSASSVCSDNCLRPRLVQKIHTRRNKTKHRSLAGQGRARLGRRRSGLVYSSVPVLPQKQRQLARAGPQQLRQVHIQAWSCQHSSSSGETK